MTDNTINIHIQSSLLKVRKCFLGTKQAISGEIRGFNGVKLCRETAVGFALNRAQWWIVRRKRGWFDRVFVRLPAWTVPLYNKSERFLCNPSYLIYEQSGDTLKENSSGGKTDEMGTSPRWKLQSDHCIYFLRNDKWIIWSPRASLQPLATLIFSWFLKAVGMKLKQLQWERATLIICYLRLSARCALIVITFIKAKKVCFIARHCQRIPLISWDKKISHSTSDDSRLFAVYRLLRLACSSIQTLFTLMSGQTI